MWAAIMTPEVQKMTEAEARARIEKFNGRWIPAS